MARAGALAVIAAAALAGGGCDWAPPPEPPETPDTPETPETPHAAAPARPDAVDAPAASIAVPTDAGPSETSPPLPAGADAVPGTLTYFAATCVRCHGRYGEQYDLVHMAELPDDELHEVIEVMVRGPSFSSLGDSAMAALTAYHRALSSGEPFVEVTWRTDGGIGGEVTPGAAVTVLTDGGAIEATVVGHTWSARISPAARATGVEASTGGATTAIEGGTLGPGSHSHQGRGSAQ